MSVVKVVRSSDVRYTRHRGTEESYQDVAVLFGADDGLGVMGCGVAKFRNMVIEDWEFAYDEFIHVLEGRVIFHVDGVPHELGPGDSIFIPKGTLLTEEIPDRVVLTFAATPINW